MALIDSAFQKPGFKWDADAARHLLNRAGFGVPPASISRLMEMTPDEAVAAFVDYEKYPDTAQAPDWIGEATDPMEMMGQMRREMEGIPDEERQRIRNMLQREEREDVQRLQMWWLDRMCHTERPLEEKMTLFWHGHFACSAEKVKQGAWNYDLNQRLRRNATGNFKTLVVDVGRSPAMLRYLDNMQNRKGRPNENWARELMELFTLGIGNYTEEDIKEAARAFTGWTVRDAEFVFNQRQHDDGVKKVLGKSGRFNGIDVIEIILGQPAAARFICTKLWRYFAYEDPEPEVVEGLAATFAGSKFELKPVLRQIFSSEGFYSARARGSMIKSPAQLVAGLQVQLDAELSDRPPLPILAMRAMGQSLFYPPNVKGWDGGRAWIDTNTLLIRCNFANYLVSGVVPEFGGGGRRVQQQARRAQESGEMMDSPMADAGGMQEMEVPQREAADGPVGQDAMPADIPGRTFADAVRRRGAQAGAGAGPRVLRAPFRAREFFARFQGMTANEIAAAMSWYFLTVPLDQRRQEDLARIIASGRKLTEPLPVAALPEENLRDAVQLLLSTAEYQVC